MSRSVLMVAAAIAITALAVHSGVAIASKSLYQFTGKVTAVPVGNRIVVNGHSYLLAAGSAAAKQAQEIVQGETVHVILTAPPNSTAAKVLVIHAAAGH